MIKNANKKKRGFTLIEIIIAVVVVSILLTVASVLYFKFIRKSETSEALANLGAIRKSEIAKRAEAGTFVNASTTEEINEKLPTSDIKENIFKYKVVNATTDDFVAVAERIKGNETLDNGSTSSSEDDEIIVIAMNMGGTVNYGTARGSGYSSGYGSSDYGGSSSGGGYSSGGGSSSGSSGGGGLGGGGTGISGGSSSGGSSSGGSSDDSSGDSPDSGEAAVSGGYGVTITEIMGVLAGSQAGAYYYNLIQSVPIDVVPVMLPGNYAGLYIPDWWINVYPETAGTVALNTIYINSLAQSVWTKEACATILIHEALHADYNHNTEKWVIETTERLGVDRSELNWKYDPVADEMVLDDSIDQEYNAFVQELELWKEIKGAQSNQELDYLLTLYDADIANGSDLLYQEIYSRYRAIGDYPDY